MNNSSHKYFICYSREDSEFALKLARDLESLDVPVWMDQLSIAPGANWDEAVEEGLESSNSVLLILSPAAVASSNVRDEWSYAVESEKILIPILLKDCKVPFRLKRRQHIDFTGDYAVGIASLKAVLRATVTVPLAENEKITEQSISVEKSLHSEQAVNVNFRNAYDSTLQGYWIDYEGQEQPWFDLAPGQTISIQTYATHPWRFRLSGRELDTYTPNEVLNQSFIVQPK